MGLCFFLCFPDGLSKEQEEEVFRAARQGNVAIQALSSQTKKNVFKE